MLIHYLIRMGFPMVSLIKVFPCVFKKRVVDVHIQELYGSLA